MAAFAIAEHADTANRQHYELPPEFFALFLGPRRKYSSCLYPIGHENLAEAEMIALAETVAHAGLADRQEIL
jgi:cyclopropane-fatty-acyl-phospholipid synthase